MLDNITMQFSGFLGKDLPCGSLWFCLIETKFCDLNQIKTEKLLSKNTLLEIKNTKLKITMLRWCYL